MTDADHHSDEAGIPRETPALPAGRATQEIMALGTGGPVAAIVPRNIEEAFRLAQLVVKAGLAPDSYEKDPSKVVIGIMKSLEVGLPPITGLSSIYLIRNRPSIFGDGAIALIQARGVILKMEHEYTGTPGEDDWTCHVRMWRRGQSEPYAGEFSIGDAKRAKLWANPKKIPWIEYPDRMLFNRARAFAVRDGFADCLSGLAIAEEMQDLPEAPKPVDAGFLIDDRELDDAEHP